MLLVANKYLCLECELVNAFSCILTRQCVFTPHNQTFFHHSVMPIHVLSYYYTIVSLYLCHKFTLIVTYVSNIQYVYN